jgi:hypothetical protein
VGDAPSDNLYVFQLPANTDDAFLQELFAQVGNVMSVKCVPDKRYGFVRFSTPEEASIAIEEIDGLECEGTIIRVKYADNKVGGSKKDAPREPPRVVEPPSVMPSSIATQRSRIFVQDLPLELSKDAVAHMLERYCVGSRCEFLFRDSSDQVAMISVPTIDDARYLAESLHGNIPDGMSKPIRIAVSLPVVASPRRVPVPAPSYSRAPTHPPERPVPYQKPVPSQKASGSRRDSDEAPNDNIYVNQLPPGFDEARLDQLFSGCGRIKSLKCFSEQRYGFVRFTTVEEASRAIDTVNGIDIDGSVIVCKFAQNKKGA